MFSFRLPIGYVGRVYLLKIKSTDYEREYCEVP